jgi:bacteriorhodopsin
VKVKNALINSMYQIRSTFVVSLHRKACITLIFPFVYHPLLITNETTGVIFTKLETVLFHPLDFFLNRSLSKKIEC